MFFLPFIIAWFFLSRADAPDWMTWTISVGFVVMWLCGRVFAAATNDVAEGREGSEEVFRMAEVSFGVLSYAYWFMCLAAIIVSILR